MRCDKYGDGRRYLVLVRQTGSAGDGLATLFYGLSGNLCGTLWWSALSLPEPVCITFTEVLLKAGDAFYMLKI